MMNKKTMDMRKATKDQELRKLALLSERELMMELRTSEKGLSNEDAEKRLEEFGPNEVSAQKANPSNYFIFKCIQRSVCLCLSLIDGRFNFNERFRSRYRDGRDDFSQCLDCFYTRVSFSKSEFGFKRIN